MDSKGRASANWSRSVRLARSLGRKDADEEAKSTTKSRDLNLGEYGDRLIENLTSQEARGAFHSEPLLSGVAQTWNSHTWEVKV